MMGKRDEKAPEAPAHLKESAELWEQIAQGWELDPAGLAILELACIQLDRAADARRVVDEQGQFTPGRYGIKQNPAVIVEQRATAAAAALLKQLQLEGDQDKPARGRPAMGAMYARS